MATPRQPQSARPKWGKLVQQLLARTFANSPGAGATIQSSVFLSSPWTSNRIFASFILASLPAAAITSWRADGQIPQQLTLLLVALVVAAVWELVFARWRGRAPDSAWLMTAWLFTVLLPPSVSPWLAALALSFGVVIGAHIFGGTGKYLVSPALLGILFLHFSYPGTVQATLPITDFEDFTIWLLACGAGAAYLVYAGSVSWRILAGGVLAIVLAGTAATWFAPNNVAAGFTWYEHLALGNFAFILAFVATDPSTSPLTRLGRWYYGITIGLLTIVIRVLDPIHPEGTLFAVLLAALIAPFFDYLILRRHISTNPGGTA